MELDIAYYLNAYCAACYRHAPHTLCSDVAFHRFFVSSVAEEGQAMLPPEKHERALQLFCRILHRLEERDRTHADPTTHAAKESPEQRMEPVPTIRDAHTLSLSSVPASLNPRATE